MDHTNYSSDREEGLTLNVFDSQGVEGKYDAGVSTESGDSSRTSVYEKDKVSSAFSGEFRCHL